MQLSIEALIEKMKNMPQREAKPYYVNGIPYCAICNAPKRKRLYWFDREGIPIKCKCELAEERNRIKDEYLFRHKNRN